MSTSSKRTLLYMANSLLHSNPRYCLNNNVASFTSTSKSVQGGIKTSGDIREGGRRVADTCAGMPNKTKLGKEEEHSTDELAKAGVAAAVETGLKVGEMTKQAVDGVWDAAKETAEGVRDSVEQPNKEEAVEDLRRRAGGYDLKNHNFD